MKRTTHALAAILIAALLIVSFGAALDAQGIRQQFEHVIARALTVNGATTINSSTTINGELTANGATTINGAATFNGSSNFAGHIVADDYFATTDWVYLIPPPAMVITDGATITPTATVMELTATAPAGAELINAADGQFLVLVNTGAQTITISDTATIEATGDIALGQNDTLTLIGVGVKWYQIAASNN